MISELLTHYDSLRTKEKDDERRLPKLTLCNVVRQAKPATTLAELKALIEGFNPEQGWLTFQSQVAWFTCGETLPAHGRIVNAELSRGETSSLHIREDGNGGWITTQYTRTPGDSHLYQRSQFISEEIKNNAGKPITQLQYETYWSTTPDQGVIQIAARFTGFNLGTGENA